MGIKQFRYGEDNLGYLVFGKQKALVVDGGAVREILQYAGERGLQIIYAANTHMHADHTRGTQEIIDYTGATYLDNGVLLKSKTITLDGKEILVSPAPGHTSESLLFQMDSALLTGDTLFNGTIGNCFSGDLVGFYRTITHLMAFPDQIRIYAGHDYVRYAMDFARTVDPDNLHIDRYLKNYNPGHVFSTLGDEKKVNPYLRFNEPVLAAALEKRGLPVETAYERWESIMSIE